MADINAISTLLTSMISTSWEKVSDALNSQFGIATTGSFFGAVGGYVIVLFTNNRAEVLSKIDRIKVAIALTHSLFNLTYNSNKQFISGLYECFENDKKLFIEARSGQSIGTVKLLYNNTTLNMPYVDFELVNSKLLRETVFAGRPFLLATELIRCLHELSEQLQNRHTILKEIHRISTENKFTPEIKACWYYGIEIETLTGVEIHREHSDVMLNIKNFTEDCIWFSKALTLELIQQGTKEAEKIYIRRPKIGTISYSDVDQKYMPNEDNYKDWTEKFKKA